MSDNLREDSAPGVTTIAPPQQTRYEQPHMQQTTQQQNIQNTQQAVPSFMNGLGFKMPSISGSPSREACPRILKVFEDICLDISSRADVKIFASMLDEPDLAIPAVVLIMPEGNNKIFYTVFLLSHLAANAIPTLVEQNGFQKIELPRTADSYWTPTMERKVLELLMRRMKNPDEKAYIQASVTVLPAFINYESRDKVAFAFDHAITSLNIRSLIDKKQATGQLTFRAIKSDGFELTVRCQINPAGVTTSSLGYPIASDFNLMLSAVNTRINKEDIHDLQRSVVLTKVTGMVDFMPVSSRSETKTLPNHKVTFPVVIPVFIIRESTSVKSGSTSNTDSLLTQIFGVLMLKMFSDNTSRWGQIYEPGNTNLATSDIGTLGLYASPYPETSELGKHTIVPSSAGLSNGQVMGKRVADLLEEYCSVQPLYAIDIIAGGPLEMIQNILVSPELAVLLARDLDAFAGITSIDSGFMALWSSKGGPTGTPVLDPNPPLNTYALQFEGSFDTADGISHDINEIDLLCQLTQNVQTENLSRYVDTKMPGANSSMDMKKKEEFLRTVAPQAVITGNSKRYFLNPSWISLVDQFLSDNRITITLDEGLMVSSNSFGIHRANVMAPTQTHTFQQSNNRISTGTSGIHRNMNTIVK